MNLDDQSVCTGSDSRKSKRQYEIGYTTCMTRIDYHWEMALTFDNGNRRDVECVSRRSLERPDSPLADNHLTVPVRHDILGRHEQLRYGCHESTFQKYRPLNSSKLRKQGKVLHLSLIHISEPTRLL